MDISNITSQQRDLLAKLEAENRTFTYAWDEVRGALFFARREDLSSTQPRAATESETAQRAALAAFLEKYGTLFGLTDGANGLQPTRTTTDDIGFVHYQYQQFADSKDGRKDRRRVEVYGSRLAA